MDFNAAGFSHVDCGVLASEMGIGGANDKTMMGWANCHNFSSSTDGVVFMIGNTGAVNELFAMRVRSTNSQWRADFWDNWIQFSTPTTSVNTWWHYAMTYDGTTARVYANGVERGTKVITLDTTDALGMYLGVFDQPSGIKYFDGDIADVRAYSRTLSQAEIMTIYTAKGVDGIVDGLEARWPMTDIKVGTTLASSFVADTEEGVGSVSSTTVDVPSNTDGDLLIACIGVGGDSSGTPANVTTPSGWTFITSVDAPTTLSTPSIWLYEREASSEPSTYTWTINQTCTATSHMNCYQNVTTTNDVSATNSGTSTSAVTPSVTFTSPGGAYLVVRFAITDLNTAFGSDPWPLGVNQRNLTKAIGASTNGCGLCCSDHIRSSTTAGTKSFAMTNDQWATATVAFKASPAVRGVSGSSEHPHDADVQFTVTTVETVLRI